MVSAVSLISRAINIAAGSARPRVYGSSGTAAQTPSFDHPRKFHANGTKTVACLKHCPPRFGVEWVGFSGSSRSSSWRRVLTGKATSSCPSSHVQPVTSEREKISFHQLNKKTGHRIKYRKVDAETADEVDSADIIKGYEVGKGEYVELDPEELEAVAIESKRTIDIDEFVPKDEIDELYLNNPYYIAPDGEVGQHIAEP
jgi:hypothetical protein